MSLTNTTETDDYTYLLEEVRIKARKELAHIQNALFLKEQIFAIAPEALQNVEYFKFEKELELNWKDHGYQIPDKIIERIKALIELPQGVTLTVGKKY